MDRRHFLGVSVTLALAVALRAAAPGRAPRILLRSSWQTVNIGDIAHTPGMLALLEKHLPEAEITLWPGSVDNGVGEMLHRRFPKLRILVPGKIDVALAYADHDFLLHGSGPSLVAEKDVARWRQLGPKPYGVLGITQGKPTPATIEILNGAQFVFFRDGVSHTVALSAGVAILTVLEGDPQPTGNREDCPLFRDPHTGLELTYAYAAARLKALLILIGAVALSAGSS